MEPKDSLLCFQGTATGPYPKPDEIIPHPYTLYNFLHPLVTSSLLSLNILLRTLFSNTLTRGSSIRVRDQVSHPNKTTGKIIVLYISIFRYFGRR